jgi:phage terminase large subunit
LKKTLKVNEKLLPFLTQHKPIKVAYSGRDAGKSIAFGDILTCKMERERADVLCLREYMESIAGSVHRVFKGSIDRLGLEGWQVLDTKIVSPHGNVTRYIGTAHNADSIQSAEGYRYSWCEEAHTMSQESIDKLLPTIIRRPGAECWFSANPQSSADPFSQRFILPFQKELDRNGYYEDDLHMIVKLSWRDNPWYDDATELLRLHDKKTMSSARYNWIWEGDFNDTVDNAIISAEWFDACIDAHIKLGIKAEGLEVVSHDPSDVGTDDKALAYRHGIVVKDVQYKSDGNVNDGGDWALAYVRDKKPDAFVWDVDGVGAGLKRQIDEAIGGKAIRICPFSGGGKKNDEHKFYDEIEGEHLFAVPKTNAETFYNLRAQCYWDLRDRCYRTYQAVTHGKYMDPEKLISFSSEMKDILVLRSELCRIPRKPGGTKIQIMSKEDMKKMKIRSPNGADAVMMLFDVSALKKKKRQDDDEDYNQYLPSSFFGA